MHFDPTTSAVQQVSQRFDGRIPAGLMRAADAIDRARKPSVSYLRLSNVELKPDAIVRAMAGAILEGWSKRGSVHEQDFRRAGISVDQIEQYRDAALKLACSREPRIESMFDGVER